MEEMSPGEAEFLVEFLRPEQTLQGDLLPEEVPESIASNRKAHLPRSILCHGTVRLRRSEDLVEGIMVG